MDLYFVAVSGNEVNLIQILVTDDTTDYMGFEVWHKDRVTDNCLMIKNIHCSSRLRLG